MGLPSMVVIDERTGWWYLWPLVPVGVEDLRPNSVERPSGTDPEGSSPSPEER